LDQRKANAHPIGTGAYTLAEEHKKGGPIKLVTVLDVANNWRVTPQFKTVTFLGISEEAMRIAMLKTGEADLAPISYDSIDTVKASGGNIITIPLEWAPEIRMYGMVTSDPKRYDANNPWAKKEVRQALNYTVDKESIAKNIFKGEAKPAGADVAIPSWLDIPPYPYDPAKAKQLLAAAGYSTGFTITLKTYPSNPGAELPIIAQAVAQYWKAIGIDVQIVPTDSGTIMNESKSGQNIHYMNTFANGTFADPQVPLGMTYDSNNQVCGWATEDSMNMLNKFRQELDPAKRMQLAKDMALYLHDEASAVFLLFVNEPWGASKKVGSWPTTSMRASNMDMITHP
jgi:peptide/nickel transport system substrate-binding protein